MSKRFYKHKTLLDEQVSPRQHFPRLNERFDVKHIKHDLSLGSLPDPQIYALAVSQGRIILTKNVKDFRVLLRELESTEFSATRRVRAAPVPGAAVRG